MFEFILLKDFEFITKSDLLIAEIGSDFIEIDNNVIKDSKDIKCIACKKTIKESSLFFCSSCKNVNQN